ncbi:MAG: hypothetical protein AB8H79_25815 [Myxococcota bacterium]
MKPGHTIGPWTLEAPLDTPTAAATTGSGHASDGTRASIWRLAPPSLLDAWRSASAQHPAWLRPSALPGDGDLSLASAAALDPVEPAALQGPEAASVVAAIGARLGAALRDSPKGLIEHFSAENLSFDESGTLFLVPSTHTLPPQADPLRAPEWAKGAPSDSATLLFDLGVWLYQLATGAPPVVNPERGGLPNPPSAAQPDLPAELNRAIMTLLSANPGERSGALAALHDLASPLPDLRRLAGRSTAQIPDALPKRPARSEVQYTTTGGSPARTTASPSLAAVPADARLTPSQRSELAGLLGLPMAQVSAAEQAGQPLVVPLDGHALPATPLKKPSLLAPLGATGLGATGVGLMAVGAVVAIATLGVGLAGVALGAALTGVAGWMATSWWTNQSHYNRAIDNRRVLEGISEQAAAHPLVGAARARLFRIRAAIAAGHLPEAAEIDVRAGLDEVDDDLDLLARTWDADPSRPEPDPLSAKAAAIEQGLVELEQLLRSAEVEATTEVGSAISGLIAAARHAADAVSPDDAKARARRANAASKQRS